ncbi:hypothetical protein [Nonlabens sp. SY33080]|uniref:hypothetical protein n=1 Tax=unclassified Nonlabens TaxID=2615035 RepID=UPI001428AE28|nr:hypothetical protein [Nonlabens sp. SY33080]
MTKTYKVISILIISLTLIWLVYAGFQPKWIKWQLMTAGGIHFIMSFIINRQYHNWEYNYLGIIHGTLMVVLMGWGYFFV